MKAALFREPNVMALEQVPDPLLEPGDMLLRMRAAAICGTDIRVLRGRKVRGVRKPSILGHEFVGEIVETGGHAGFSRGDTVAVCPALSCGSCRECRMGAENICSRLVAYGYELDGGFAELICVPSVFVERSQVTKLPEALPPDLAALAEPLACVINGQDLLDVPPGQTVAVLGVGPIGLLHVMLAKQRGAARVIAVQRSAHRRAAALDMGADEAFTAEEAEGLAIDASIVAVGSPELANLAARITRPRGRISLFAGFPAGEATAFDLNAIHYGEHLVTGAFGLTGVQFAEALDLIAAGVLPVKKLVSHRLPLAEVEHAFALAEQGSALKVVVTG
jgi:L-iditol 2-dehydrogenase